MNNTIALRAKSKKLLIAVICTVVALAIIVPTVTIAVLGNSTPLKFLMKTDLSKYVSVSIPEKINYADIRESLGAGYDLFRVSITESYFGNAVYVEEGTTLDFKLSAELVTTTESGAKEYTAIELPAEYAEIKGYRPYSKAENLFFDKALAGVGEKDESGIDYMVRDKASKFTMTVPEEERFGDYAGKKIRFTITVTDYVARYAYIYGGADNSIAIVGDWYCQTAKALVSPAAGATVEEGDIILYDCVDTYSDGTVKEYLDTYMEVTSDYIKYFGGRKDGEKFTETVQNIKEEFTVKAVYKAADIEVALKTLGYESVYSFKEELRIWCYAVYSDGIMAIITKQTELAEYPKNLINTFTKLEDQTWETEFRKSALAFAQAVGDEIALETYEVTGYATVQEYLDDMLKDHVDTLVRELVISYSMAQQMGKLDELYERYNESIKNYIKANQYSTKREALESLSANGDEACILYTNFLSPVLGTEFAKIVEGANFTEFIADSYVK